MARIRSIHPSACTSEKLSIISAEAERCYWRLQTQCDDEGRCDDHPRLLWAAMFPLHRDVREEQVDGWLDELHRAGLIVRYQVGDRAYLAVMQWDRHQSPKHPKPSQIPSPDDGVVRRIPRIGGHVSPDRGNGSPKRGHTSPRVGEELRGSRRGKKEDVRGDVRPPDGVEEDFETAWAAYPKRPNNSKTKARRAYLARRKAGVTAEALLAGVRAYAAYVAREGVAPQFIKHAATFFGPDEHWLTEYGPVEEAKHWPYLNAAGEPDPDGDIPNPKFWAMVEASR